MLRSKYFTMYEMTYSDTAYKLKLDNTPDEESEQNLIQLMEVLDDIREKWGGPIRVTSGFRAPQVNAAVGGSKTSAHLRGFAADLRPYNNKFKDFQTFIKNWAKTGDYDQILLERNSQGMEWVHIGLFNSKNQQRHQVKNLEVK